MKTERRGILVVAAAVAAVQIAAATPVGAAVPADHPALAWGGCPPQDPDASRPRDPRMRCAVLRVPQDYRDPRGAQLTITVSRIPTAEPGPAGPSPEDVVPKGSNPQ